MQGGVRIEELDDNGYAYGPSGDQPIVEEPDDGARGLGLRGARAEAG